MPPWPVVPVFAAPAAVAFSPHLEREVGRKIQTGPGEVEHERPRHAGHLDHQDRVIPAHDLRHMEALHLRNAMLLKTEVAGAPRSVVFHRALNSEHLRDRVPHATDRSPPTLGPVSQPATELQPMPQGVGFSLEKQISRSHDASELQRPLRPRAHHSACRAARRPGVTHGTRLPDSQGDIQRPFYRRHPPADHRRPNGAHPRSPAPRHPCEHTPHRDCRGHAGLTGRGLSTTHPALPTKVAQLRRNRSGFKSGGFGRHGKIAPVGRIVFGSSIEPFVISTSTGPPDLELFQTSGTKPRCNP